MSFKNLSKTFQDSDANLKKEKTALITEQVSSLISHDIDEIGFIRSSSAPPKETMEEVLDFIPSFDLDEDSNPSYFGKFDSSFALKGQAWNNAWSGNNIWNSSTRDSWGVEQTEGSKKDVKLFSTLLRKKIADEYPYQSSKSAIGLDDDECLNDAFSLHMNLNAEVDKENFDKNVKSVRSVPSSPARGFTSPSLVAAVPPLLNFPESSVDPNVFGWNEEDMSTIRPKSVNGRPSPNIYGEIRRPFSPQPSLLSLKSKPMDSAFSSFSSLNTNAPEFTAINLDMDITHFVDDSTPASTSSPRVDATRSSILEEFRTNKGKRYEIRDLQQYVVEFSCDQHGSRFIQQKLESATDEEKQMVFNELQPHALKLMTDVFGNYVIQKLFEHGSAKQKEVLASQMRGHVLVLSLQMYGCRVVQKALEHVSVEQQAILIKELDGQVLKCVKDQNGNHVIQKCIERVPSEMIQFIVDSFSSQIYTLATHPYGCRVIQRIFEHCTVEQTQPLLEEIHRCLLNLIQDQYGNYVIQHILEHGPAAEKQRIMDRVTGNVLTFSKHKFASNVVEKCVAHGTGAQQAKLLDELLQSKGEVCALFQMMKDQYANYVVQKMLDVFRGENKALLISKIKPLIPQLKKFSYGKHIITKLESGTYKRDRH